MEKITTVEQVEHMQYGAGALDVLGLYQVNDDNFWKIREQARIEAGIYTPVKIDGDDAMRFLHVSLDDPDRVSYTKNADKGVQDLQTRTTIEDYCEKFGLDVDDGEAALVRATVGHVPYQAAPVPAGTPTPAADPLADCGTSSAEFAVASSELTDCMMDLAYAIAQVDALKAQLRTLLG